MTLGRTLLKFCLLILLVGLLVGLVACSDDNTTTNSDEQAQITQANALSFTTVITQQQAPQFPTDSLFGSFLPGSGLAGAQAISGGTAVFPIETLKADFEAMQCVGNAGSIDIIDNSVAANFSVSLTFNNFCIDDGVVTTTLDGTMSMSADSTGFTFAFVNFTYSSGGVSDLLNCSMTMDMTGAITQDSCGLAGSVGTGSGSGSGSVSSPQPQPVESGTNADNVTVTGDDTTGYVVAGRVSNNGEYAMISTPEPIFFDLAVCEAGQPIAGLVKIEGSNGSSATANFSDGDNDCTTFSLCVYTDALDEGNCTSQNF